MSFILGLITFLFILLMKNWVRAYIVFMLYFLLFVIFLSFLVITLKNDALIKKINDICISINSLRVILLDRNFHLS